MKFQRFYTLTVQGRRRTHVIESPLTLDLDISKSTLSDANSASFTIYNLNEETRNDIFHDRYDINNYKGITLEAGYESEPDKPIVFKGNVFVAGSRRIGTEWITKIEAKDGIYGMINGQVSINRPKEWSLKQTILDAIKTMQHVTPNVIGDFKSQNTRGIIVSGNSWDAIQKLAGKGIAYIDNEGVNVLGENEAIRASAIVPIITSDTGLLNTPQRQEAIITADMLFEPRIVIGQLVEVQSQERINNGLYQVRAIRHAGRISGAFDGGVVTTLSLWIGTVRLTEVGFVRLEGLV